MASLLCLPEAATLETTTPKKRKWTKINRSKRWMKSAPVSESFIMLELGAVTPMLLSNARPLAPKAMPYAIATTARKKIRTSSLAKQTHVIRWYQTEE